MGASPPRGGEPINWLISPKNCKKNVLPPLNPPLVSIPIRIPYRTVILMKREDTFRPNLPSDAVDTSSMAWVNNA